MTWLMSGDPVGRPPNGTGAAGGVPGGWDSDSAKWSSRALLNAFMLSDGSSLSKRTLRLPGSYSTRTDLPMLGVRKLVAMRGSSAFARKTSPLAVVTSTTYS